MNEIGADLLARTCKSSMIVWVIGLCAAWALGGLGCALGWTAGGAVSLGVLWGLDWVVRRSFVPGQTEARRSLARFSLAKLVVVVAVMVVVVLAGKRDLTIVLGFAAGVLLAQAVIVLGVAWRLVCPRAG